MITSDFAKRVAAQDLTRTCAGGTVLRVHTAKVLREVSAPRGKQYVKLSSREFVGLCYRLLGYTHIEIYALCQTSTLSSMGRVRNKLMVSNDMELAYLAYERGWVVIDDAAEYHGTYQCTKCDWTGPWAACVHRTDKHCPMCSSPVEPETGECGGGAPMGVSPSPNYK